LEASACLKVYSGALIALVVRMREFAEEMVVEDRMLYRKNDEEKAVS
jgi:hypothetical protein